MPDLDSEKADAADGNRWLVPSWVASVNSTANRLTGELRQALSQPPPPGYEASQQTIEEAVKRAKCHARRLGLIVSQGRFRRLRSMWRRIADWWTGNEAEQAWAGLHTANQTLLAIQAPGVVKSQLADMTATVLTSLDPTDVRRKSYLTTLQLLAPASRDITPDDRAQLRVIRQVCDSCVDSGHADARAFRNMMIIVGSFLAAVLAIVAIVAWLDPGFRSIFSAAKTLPAPWYVFELELIASLSGLTGAVLSLKNYTGFQYSFGLPFVQAFLKGTTGAATGLFGVLLVRSGITTSLTLKPGASTFAVAIVFGYAQYLFTRLLDQQANAALKSAGSRSDPGITPEVPPGGDAPDLMTINAAPGPQLAGVSPNHGQATGCTPVTLTGSGFSAAHEVNFGSNAATHVTIDSDTQITVISPPGNGTVTITVRSPVGVSPVSSAAQFTYEPVSTETGDAPQEPHD